MACCFSSFGIRRFERSSSNKAALSIYLFDKGKKEQKTFLEKASEIWGICYQKLGTS
jgi:hypothetical protein